MKLMVLIIVGLVLYMAVRPIWSYPQYESQSACAKHPYQNCNPGKPDHINVHIISHTHNDLGWIKTINQYYNASDYNQNAEPTVKAIIGISGRKIQPNGLIIYLFVYFLDSVVSELAANPSRKFIYAEMGYFWMWWNEQNEDKKALVRSLVDQGRLEFIMGSW